MTRRVCYVSGTRADFGLMRSVLCGLHADPAFDLDLLVTGMHLDDAYGHTVDEIVAAGLLLRARIPVPLEPVTGATMARNIGTMITAFVDALVVNPPDLVLLLGDRGEMLAAAVAALHLNLPIVHVHGGERSGTIDEPVRHAISKLSHVHLVATQQSHERLLRMGEAPGSVFVTGAPGLDGLADLATLSRADLCAATGLDPQVPVALLLYHPVLQDAHEEGTTTRLILSALFTSGCQVVALMPNADAGSGLIRSVLLGATAQPGLRVLTHLERRQFVSWLAACNFMVGNSSAGIIEAATFNTPVLNLGTRQNLRERSSNVVDIALQAESIKGAIATVLASTRVPVSNVYGDGSATPRIIRILREIPLNRHLLGKSNAY